MATTYKELLQRQMQRPYHQCRLIGCTKVPIYFLRHRPPALIFCNRIYHHCFYLHISATLNKRAIGVVSMQRRSSCHHACHLLSWEIPVAWIMVIPAGPNCAQGKHLKRNYRSTNWGLINKREKLLDYTLIQIVYIQQACNSVDQRYFSSTIQSINSVQ